MSGVCALLWPILSWLISFKCLSCYPFLPLEALHISLLIQISRSVHIVYIFQEVYFRQILSDTEREGRGRNSVLTDSLGALRSLRLSSHSLYLIWAEGWNLVMPSNEQKTVPTTHGDGKGLSGTLCRWHFCLCSGFRGKDKDGLGERGSMQGQSHPSRIGEDVSSPARRDDGQTASAGC